MNIATEDQRHRAIVIGAVVLEKAIRADSSLINTGYQRILNISKIVESAITTKNLPDDELVDVAVELKEGIVNHLSTIKHALENLVSQTYKPQEVAFALSSCSATLSYLQTKYRLR
jgi:hypothetical protein